MAFSPENLSKISRNNCETNFWVYRSTDALREIAQNDYWREASPSICAGDIIFAVSSNTSPLQAAQFFVADSFAPAGLIVLAKLAEAKL